MSSIIAIGGSTGLVGQALSDQLRRRGDTVLPLIRPQTEGAAAGITWNPRKGELDAEQLRKADAIIHLGGVNIAEGSWNNERKNLIRASRVQSTELLANTLRDMGEPRPRTFLCASAIGIYGDRGDELLTETSTFGDDFLADVGKEWEAAANRAAELGVRVVNLRIGVVLAKDGGALAKMVPPFRMGAGGRVGNGWQYWSWISLTDLVNAIQFCLDNEAVTGPINLVAPNPADNRTFTKVLGRVLGRPTIFPMPKLVVRTIFGEMGDAILLSSTRVSSQKLSDLGFTFQFPELDAAFRHELEEGA